MNSYWSMPFRKKAKITLENLDAQDVCLYYQVDYTLTEVSEEAAYFHAQFRRVNKLPAKSCTRCSTASAAATIRRHLHGLGSPQSGLVGEGEVKFYLDGDKEFPTFAAPAPRTISAARTTSRTGNARSLQVFSTPYTGLAAGCCHPI